MRPAASARGFTLIEIMTVVAIIGVLSSIAIPEFGKLTLRARTSERRTILTAIANSMSDVTLTQGRIPNGGKFLGDWNPAGPLSTTKRTFNATQAGWNQLPLAIEGNTYYSYKFLADDHGGLSQTTLDTWAAGDLDGDGATSTKQISYVGFGNAYQLVFEAPLQGTEDDGTF